MNFSFLFAAFLMSSAAITTTMLTTTTTNQVYAQSNNNNGNGPCPPGFEKNRNICQAEPTVIPGECPESLGTVVTVPEGVEEGYCRTANTGAFTNPLFINACNEVGGVIVQEHPESGHCLFPAPAGEAICETGALNEANELCEIKPGRGNSNNNN